MTIQEAGLEKDLVVAYVGDGNNMAHSWLNMAAKTRIWIKNCNSWEVMRVGCWYF